MSDTYLRPYYIIEVVQKTDFDNEVKQAA